MKYRSLNNIVIKYRFLNNIIILSIGLLIILKHFYWSLKNIVIKYSSFNNLQLSIDLIIIL